MKHINHSQGGYAHRKYWVQLEGKELEWPDQRIITACDRQGKCSDEEWAAIENGAHPCHFGGIVKRGYLGDPTKAEVKVYID